MLGWVEETDLSNSMGIRPSRGWEHRSEENIFGFCGCSNLSTLRTASPFVRCLPSLRRWFLCCCWSPVAAWKFSRADWVTSLQLTNWWCALRWGKGKLALYRSNVTGSPWAQIMSFSHCDIGVQTVTPLQVATMMEVQLFRHPRWAEDAHGAFHRWCLWQRAAFRLPANRWCRLPSWHFHSLSFNEGFSKVSSELLPSAATSMVTLFFLGRALGAFSQAHPWRSLPSARFFHTTDAKKPCGFWARLFEELAGMLHEADCECTRISRRIQLF